VHTRTYDTQLYGTLVLGMRTLFSSYAQRLAKAFPDIAQEKNDKKVRALHWFLQHRPSIEQKEQQQLRAVIPVTTLPTLDLRAIPAYESRT